MTRILSQNYMWVLQKFVGLKETTDFFSVEEAL